MTQEKGKCSEFLSKVDIFSYIPVPHTYPISSSKSKIGSVIFLCIIIGFFIFDFIQFLTNNSPVINLYYLNTPNNVKYQMPLIAFGYVYGPNTNITLNDPTYLTYQFDTITSDYFNGTLQTVKTSQSVVPNCQPSWLGSYNDVYQNFSCVNNTLMLMNPPLKRLTSITQRIVLSLCNNNSNITCQTQSQINSMMAGGRFVLIINQPDGFNFKTGDLSQSDYPFQIYQFFLVPGLYNRVTLQMYPYSYQTYPNFLTTFKNKQFFYFKSDEPVSLISNVSVFNSYLIASFTIAIAAELTQVQVHYSTIIDHVSMWGALASLIFTIMALCCLAYNKNKFLKKNPSWGQFDRAMRKKLQLEAQNSITRQQAEEQQSSGIGSIRKQVLLVNENM